MGMEQEIKLRAANQDILEQILRDEAVCALQISDTETIRMNTVYYDTSDHILANRKWVLRCRAENDDTVITLKTPAEGNHLRGEWALPGMGLIEGDAVSDHVFRALFSQGAPQQILDIRDKPLQSVCGVRFTRRRMQLKIEGAVAELALDHGELHHGGRTAPLVEVELELLQGDFAPVEAFAKALAIRFGLVEEPLSKFQQTMLI